MSDAPRRPMKLPPALRPRPVLAWSCVRGGASPLTSPEPEKRMGTPFAGPGERPRRRSRDSAGRVIGRYETVAVPNGAERFEAGGIRAVLLLV
jgi:hypothetical protein